ncbi:MAG: hypothetical protein IPH75_04630 [bacterium]|nr:hypothetical protein [bacterium]
MTERLYYRDPALLEFEATIISSEKADGRYQTVLDRSAFYPTSGGQLFDTGVLGGVEVLDVIDADDSVLHITGQSVGEPGRRVAGSVNAARRKMHRQQHTAQHILSQIAVRQYQFETVSVHLGDDYGAIELNTPSIDQSQLDQLETAANEILFANWPVSILFVSGQELDKLPLRKIPSREGELRVIKVGEFDYSACGGTHCNSTAEVGVIKLIGWEKLRGHALVKFVAGSQAIEDYRLRFAVTDSLTKSLTCHLKDLNDKVDKLTGENRDQRKQLGALFKELLPIRADELAATAVTIGALKFVYKAVDGMDATTAGQLGSTVAERINGVALLVADGRLLISVGTGSKLHAGELSKQLSASIGLKGGGSNKAAQLGGADPAKLEEYKAALLSLIGHA